MALPNLSHQYYYNKDYKNEFEFDTDDVHSKSMMRSTNPNKEQIRDNYANESAFSRHRDSQYASDPAYIAQFNEQNLFLASGPEPKSRSPKENSEQLREFFKK